MKTFSLKMIAALVTAARLSISDAAMTKGDKGSKGNQNGGRPPPSRQAVSFLSDVIFSERKGVRTTPVRLKDCTIGSVAGVG
jgi:hypothetical protein